MPSATAEPMLGVTIPIAFAIALATALLVTPLMKRLALAVGATDDAKDSSRKIHTGVMPRLGGLAIVAAFYLPLILLLFVDSDVGKRFTTDQGKVFGLFLGGLAIVALGIYDDVVGANAKQKLIVQLAVALTLWALGFRIGLVSSPFGGALELGWVSLPLTILWIIGVINSVNLLDGLDGLASGVAFVAAATTFAVAFVNHNVIMMLFMAVLTGATLGFLFYNFNPATIFMGDSGSMFLGYVMAVTSVQTSTKGPTTVAMVVPILALGLPIMDTLLAMLRRFLRGQSMFSADKEHIHHRLVALGLSQRSAVLVLYSVSLVLGVAAVAMTVSNGPESAGVLLITLLLVVAFMRALGYFRVQGLRSHMQVRRHNIELRRAVRKACRPLEDSSSSQELWQRLVDACRQVGVDALKLSGWRSIGESRTWHAEDRASRGASLTARYALDAGVGEPPVLELAWCDGRHQLSREEEVAIELLCVSLTTGIDAVDEATSREDVNVVRLQSSGGLSQK